MQSLHTLEDVRARLRHLWAEFVRRRNITHRLAASTHFFNKPPASTKIEFRSVVFYRIKHHGLQHGTKAHLPRRKVCVDKLPAKGSPMDTCEKQRNAGHCKTRLSGMLNDGLCARTCGLCGGSISDVGMRGTFTFRTKRSVCGRSCTTKRTVTLKVQPTGEWQFYNITNKSSDVAAHCNSNLIPITDAHRFHL